MKLDLLAFGAHPDDVELSCGGTLLRHLAHGFKVGIADLTQGELGTRGNAALRLKEAELAAQVLGITARFNLGLPDGHLNEADVHQRMAVIRLVRRCCPDVVLCNAPRDRHPDHGHAAALVREACFLAGLHRLATEDNGTPQQPWRPRALYHYIQDQWIEPDVVIDVTAFWSKRMEAVRCFSSQFYNPESTEPTTYISQPDFLESLEWRARWLGKRIGVQYAEGFLAQRIPAVDHFFVLR
ncbi:MAG: bacillithiol biosynthesis deacetylase BshB1 [Chitinophagales bacterium]|nr:bacillithiol biosynthesis deacetylase BshB1 [Chitinophagales bacterium]MDW8428278.1 bacillithiol biosynthesis deacetylase BshB1 [Chitinophagales bacterium]